LKKWAYRVYKDELFVQFIFLAVHAQQLFYYFSFYLLPVDCYISYCNLRHNCI